MKDESVAENLAREIQDRNKRIVELEIQNKRYRKALEFYADKENYKKTSDSFSDTGHSESVVQQDEGKKARNLLRGDK